MSLGFNSTTRRSRVTNLPGAVGATLLALNRQARPATRTLAVSTNLLEARKATNALSNISKRTTVAASVKEETEVREVSYTTTVDGTTAAEHWVYGTALSHLSDANSGEECCSKGARVCLVYPMVKSNSEKIIMKLKLANATTGQIRYQWVDVYDPVTEERFVGDFSFLP